MRVYVPGERDVRVVCLDARSFPSIRRGTMHALTIAGRQHGVVTRRQLLETGVAEPTIDRWIGTGRLLVFAPGTYLVVGSQRTWRQTAMASVLSVGPGAAGSHRTAGHLLDLGITAPKQIHVTAKHGTHNGRLQRFVVHRARTLERSDIVLVDFIPVTCPIRTLVDLAAIVPEKRLASALDTALLKGVVSIDRCEAYIADRKLKHLKGVRRLRSLLADRLQGVPESELEREFLDLVERFRLPTAVRQQSAGRYRVDFAYEQQRIYIEIDGRAHHGTAEAFHDDHTRITELTLMGWRFPLLFTARHLRLDPRFVERSIRKALALAAER